MRLLYWTELFQPYIGGLEVMSLYFLPALKNRGYDVDLPPQGRL